MRSNPCSSKLWAIFSLADSHGWNPSQNTYSVAFLHVPTDPALHRNDVSIVPVPQQAFLDSKNPEQKLELLESRKFSRIGGSEI